MLPSTNQSCHNSHMTFMAQLLQQQHVKFTNSVGRLDNRQDEGWLQDNVFRKI